MESSPNNPSSIRLLGVCGGIGSGKSKACQLLVSDLGCMAHIEADSIAHTVYSPGSQAVKDAVQEFGSDILVEGHKSGEEEIDRKKLGAVVFADPQAMSKLERIVWPHVKTIIHARIDEIKEKGFDQINSEAGDAKKFPVIVLEAAVLLDAGWEDLLDGVWVVTTPPEVAVDRLVEYRGFTAEEAKKRMQAQTTRRGIGNVDEEVQKGVVTAVIQNVGNEEDLKQALLDKLNDPKAWKKP